MYICCPLAALWGTALWGLLKDSGIKRLKTTQLPYQMGTEMVYTELKGPPLPDHSLSHIFAGQTPYKHISANNSITPQVPNWVDFKRYITEAVCPLHKTVLTLTEYTIMYITNKMRERPGLSFWTQRVGFPVWGEQAVVKQPLQALNPLKKIMFTYNSLIRQHIQFFICHKQFHCFREQQCIKKSTFVWQILVRQMWFTRLVLWFRAHMDDAFHLPVDMYASIIHVCISLWFCLCKCSVPHHNIWIYLLEFTIIQWRTLIFTFQFSEIEQSEELTKFFSAIS